MTDIIPKAASGRYMGISNIAVASAGAVAGAILGPIIDVVGGGAAESGDGPRAAFVAAFAFFALSAFFLRRVDPRPRDVRLAEPVPSEAATASATA
jgi:MFS family permease